ncbi:unnamed protein product, partial [Trichobilharzia regenti]
MKSASSRSDYELCDDSGALKKSVVATGKLMLNGESQTKPQFVQEKRVTVSESSSDFTSSEGITSQSKEFENDEVDQIDDGKVDICNNGHDSVHLSLADHDEMCGMPSSTELNRGSVQLKCEVGLKADAVAEGMYTCETVSLIVQRVAHLSSDDSAKSELIVKDSSGGGLTVRQLSESRAITASDPPLSSSTGINQLSL